MNKQGVFFVAAGSGGHIYAAVATYLAFKENFPTLSENSLFVGSTLLMEGEKRRRPLEERICEHHHIPFTKIRMGKLQRSLSLRTLKHVFLVFLGFIDAFRLLRKHRPRVIAAFGGYVTFPLVLVGKLFGVKVIIHEQTSSIGLTNKILERFVDDIAVTFSTSLPYFKKVAHVVGSPTMKHIYTISEFEHLVKYMKNEKSSILDETDYLKLLSLAQKGGKNRRPVLLVSGGSQGSHFLNDQLKQLLPELVKVWNIVIQTGENEVYNDYEKLLEYVRTLPANLGTRIAIRKFLFEEYGYLLKNADLFIGRSGANTVYQVGMNGTKSIFIPIPWVEKNEQYTNAKILEETGFAKIINQDTCTPEILMAAIQEMKEKSVSELTALHTFPTDADMVLAQRVARLAV